MAFAAASQVDQGSFMGSTSTPFVASVWLQTICLYFSRLELPSSSSSKFLILHHKLVMSSAFNDLSLIPIKNRGGAGIARRGDGNKGALQCWLKMVRIGKLLGSVWRPDAFLDRVFQVGSSMVKPTKHISSLKCLQSKCICKLQNDLCGYLASLIKVKS